MKRKMVKTIKVEKFVSSKYAHKLADAGRVSIDNMGGFFEPPMRWQDYLDQFDPANRPYFEAFRDFVLENRIKECGDWHQNSDNGTPLFSDGTVGLFSFRGWGDIMAAVWSTAENKDYHYMDFYYGPFNAD